MKELRPSKQGLSASSFILNTLEKLLPMYPEKETFVVGCSCRSRFCSDCCEGRGYELRKRVTDASAFAGSYDLTMWTLTVDPKLFDSPEDAYKYLREKRCVSRWVAKLFKAGHLRSRHYFCAVEWQENTEMVHFHIVLEASFIPFHVACDMWGTFRPIEAPPWDGDGPEFGSCQFSNGARASGDAAYFLNYCTKYIIKQPSYGYPDWVLDSKKNIPRYSCSRGFWGTKTESKEPESERPRVSRTIRQRVAACRIKAVVLQRVKWFDATGVCVKESVDFLGNCAASYPDLLDQFGIVWAAPRVRVPEDVGLRLLEEIEVEKRIENRRTPRSRRYCSFCGTDKEGGSCAPECPDYGRGSGESVPAPGAVRSAEATDWGQSFGRGGVSAVG